MSIRRSEQRSPVRYRLPMGLSALLLCLLVTVSITTGCSSPPRAPVVSRERPIKQVSSTGVYRVRRGDTLYSIAWRYGLDHRTLARWNGIRPPYTIYPGQRLRLTQPASRSPVPGKSSRPATKSTQQTGNIVGTKEDTVGRASGASQGAAGKQTTTRQKVQTEDPPGALKLVWAWPTKGRVDEGFAAGDPLRKGVKISGRAGQPVTAAESGKVVYAGSGLIGYGRLIIIKHNKYYLSAYGYNRKILVKEGDSVSKGARIAEMGSNGDDKSQLHFEIRRNGKPLDPLRLLPRRR